MIQQSLKKSSLFQDVIITHKKFYKLTNLTFFRVISILTVRQTYLKMLSPLKLMTVIPGDRREPPADTLCPLAAQRKASEARL